MDFDYYAAVKMHLWDSEYLPHTPQGDLDILKIIGDFCKQEDMWPHIIALVFYLLEFNRGEA